MTRRPCLKVALYARTTAAEAGRDPEPPLVALAAYAATRGWETALECTDPLLSPNQRREGLQRLLAAAQGKTIQAVLVRSLSHVARSLRHLTDLGNLLAAHDVALIALEDHLDTTEPAGAIRWRDWLDIATRVDHQLRSEAAKLAHLRTPDERWGRPAVAINPLELLTWWEGRGGRRPLSLRELAGKLGLSEATVRKHLRTLRAAGKVNDEARARALATRGGLPKGGRPANPLDDEDLLALWRKNPSPTAIAHRLGVSRNRVRVRLHEIGLLNNLDAPASARSHTPPTTPSEVPVP